MAISKSQRKLILRGSLIQITFIAYEVVILIVDYYVRTNGFTRQLPNDSRIIAPPGLSKNILYSLHGFGFLLTLIFFYLLLKNISLIKRIAITFTISFLLLGEIFFISLYYVLSAHIGAF